MNDQWISWLLHYLLHRAYETQQGRNSCPGLQFGFQFGLYRVVACSISLASLLTSHKIHIFSPPCNILYISVKVQVEGTLILILTNYLTLLPRMFFGWCTACTNCFLEKFPLQECFFWSPPPPPPGSSNCLPLRWMVPVFRTWEVWWRPRTSRARFVREI